VPIYAFVEDTAASGGYYIACGANEIYASESSIVGSIGVLSQSFGLVELVKRLGIEVRLQTAGQNKAIDNPFIEQNETAIARKQHVLNAVHTPFINAVKASRGERLNGEDERLFNGDFWTGKDALELGLIDGIEPDMQSFIEKKFGKDIKIVKVKENPFARIFKPLMSAEGVISEVMDQLEVRLNEISWTARYK